MPKLLPSPLSSTSSVKNADLFTLYSAAKFTDTEIDDASHVTPSSEKEDLDHAILHTDYIFIRKLNSDEDLECPIDPADNPVFKYSIENFHRETILLAKYIQLRPDENGRTPICYDVINPCNQAPCMQPIFSIDGHESMFGMHVLLKGHHEVVRGKISSLGLFHYVIKDFLTGRTFSVSLPPWMVFFNCLVGLFQPTLNIEETTAMMAPKIVAKMGKKRWDGTLYEQKIKFGLHFEEANLDADKKLFIFSSALAFFHLYYRTLGREIKFLLFYVAMFFIVIVIIVGIFYLVEMPQHNRK